MGCAAQMACMADLDLELISDILLDEHLIRFREALLVTSRSGHVDLFDSLLYSLDFRERDVEERDQELFDRGIYPPLEEIAPICLQYAVMGGQIAIIDLLADEYEVEPTRDPQLLHMAACFGRTRTIKHLVEVYGLDVHRKSQGHTARRVAIQYGERAAAELLLKYETEMGSQQGRPGHRARRPRVRDDA